MENRKGRKLLRIRSNERKKAWKRSGKQRSAERESKKRKEGKTRRKSTSQWWSNEVKSGRDKTGNRNLMKKERKRAAVGESGRERVRGPTQLGGGKEHPQESAENLTGIEGGNVSTSSKRKGPSAGAEEIWKRAATLSKKKKTDLHEETLEKGKGKISRTGKKGKWARWPVDQTKKRVEDENRQGDS